MCLRSYSLDDTLALCQERGVADATAYLLERKGDVTGALSLALRTLSSRLSSLRSALQSANLRDIAAEMAFVSPSSPSKRTAVEAWSTTPQSSGWGHVPWSAGGGIAGGSAGSTLGGAGPRAGTAAWARWASKVALEGLQEVIRLGAPSYQSWKTLALSGNDEHGSRGYPLGYEHTIRMIPSVQWSKP